MEKFDVTRYKYQIILILVVMTFVLAVWHAFTYIPAKSDTKPIEEQPVEVVVTPNAVQPAVEEETAEEEEEAQVTREKSQPSDEEIEEYRRFTGSKTADSDEYIRSTRNRRVGDY